MLLLSLYLYSVPGCLLSVLCLPISAIHSKVSRELSSASGQGHSF